MYNLKNTVIILNGPVGSGKDTIADEICRLTGAKHERFKSELYSQVASYFKLNLEFVISVCSDRVLKEQKNRCFALSRKELDLFIEYFPKASKYYDRNNRILNLFLGYFPKAKKYFKKKSNLFYLSPRDAMIYISEAVIKPIYGKSFFGEAASKKLDLTSGTVFSDGGFIEEIAPIADKAKKENVFIFHLERKGTSFINDSRNYLNIPGISTFTISNNSFVKDAAEEILNYIVRCRNADKEYIMTTFGNDRA